MDWTTILKAQQTDFIQRLKSGDLLHCEKEGQHSELTVISGDNELDTMLLLIGKNRDYSLQVIFL